MSMEQPNKKGILSFRVVGVISMLLAAIAFVAMPAAFAAQYADGIMGEALNLGDVLYYFFLSNGFTIVLFFVLLLGLLAIKNNRALFAKILLWGILLCGVLYSGEFFSSMYYFPQVGYLTAVDYCSRYLPTICAVVSIVALLAQWEEGNKKTTNLISMIGAIVGVYMTIYYLVRIVLMELDVTTEQAPEIVGRVTGLAAAAMINVVVYMATRSRRIFDKVVYAMTDEEAALVEGVEDKVETVVNEFEEEMLDEIAQRMEDEEREAEALKAEGASAEEKVREMLDEVDEKLRADEGEEQAPPDEEAEAQEGEAAGEPEAADGENEKES